jgi:hypothetical protein
VVMKCLFANAETLQEEQWSGMQKRHHDEMRLPHWVTHILKNRKEKAVTIVVDEEVAGCNLHKTLIFAEANDCWNGIWRRILMPCQCSMQYGNPLNLVNIHHVMALPFATLGANSFLATYNVENGLENSIAMRAATPQAQHAQQNTSISKLKHALQNVLLSACCPLLAWNSAFPLHFLQPAGHSFCHSFCFHPYNMVVSLRTTVSCKKSLWSWESACTSDFRNSCASSGWLPLILESRETPTAKSNKHIVPFISPWLIQQKIGVLLPVVEMLKKCPTDICYRNPHISNSRKVPLLLHCCPISVS